MCVSDVNVLSCCKLAEHVDPWLRNSTELRRAMCNVGWPEAKQAGNKPAKSAGRTIVTDLRAVLTRLRVR